jgi:DNA-directed RNA polymerase subunit N
MIPVRCFTCGKVIANKWQRYKSHLEDGMTKEKALDTVGLTRYCCRRMFLGHVELTDQLLLFPNGTDSPSEQKSEKIASE